MTTSGTPTSPSSADDDAFLARLSALAAPSASTPSRPSSDAAAVAGAGEFGIGGEGSLDIDRSKLHLGEGVVWIPSMKMVCGGLVGQAGTRFCLRGRGQCSTRSHQLSKVKLDDDDAVLAIRAGPSMAACTPVIVTNQALTSWDPDMILDKVLNKELTPDKWVEEFQLLEAQFAAGGEEDALNVTRENMEGIMAPKTPFKMVKVEGKGLLDEGLDEEDGEDMEATLMDVADKMRLISLPVLDEQQRENIQQLSIELADYIASWEEWVKQFKTVSDESHSVLGSFQDGVTSVVKALSQKIGNPSAYLSKSNGLVTSVWGRIGEMQESMNQAEHAAVVNMAEVRSNHKKQQAFNGRFLDTLGGYKDSIEDLFTRVDLLGKRLDSLGVSDTMGTPRRENATLDPFGAVELLPPPSAKPIHSAPSETVLHRELRNAESASRVSELAGRVSLLEARLGSLSGDKGADENSRIVSMCGTTFNSARDMHDWVEKYVLVDDGFGSSTIPPFAVFVDPYTLYQKLVETILGSEFEYKSLSAQFSLRFNGDEMAAMAAFYSPVPSIFSGPPKSTDSIYTGGGKGIRFPHLKTYKQFEDDGHRDGLRVQIDAHKPHVENAVNTMIGECLYGENRAEARALATKMLSKSLEFITAVNTYITDTYKEVYQSSGDPAVAWDLVTFIIQQMFKEEFHVVRAGIKGGIDPAKPKTMALRIMWASFRTMEVVESFLRLGIKNHPSVSSSYVRFMVTNSQAAEVRKLLDQMVSFEKEFKSLKSDFASVEKKVTSIQTTADKAMSVANAAKKKSESGGGGRGS